MSGSAANTLWARSFVDELGRLGLREVVVAPGSRSTPLVLAFSQDDRFTVRVHLDERSAAFFALGTAKVTGRPAAVVTTSGTAVANTFPAVVEACQSGVPLVVLSADRPPRLRGADANQAIDQTRIFGDYPRAFFEMSLPRLDDRALRHVRTVACRAYAVAIGSDPGPVHVNFPFDKPLEPEDPPADYGSDHPLAVDGRSGGAPFVEIGAARPRLPDSEIERVAESIDGARVVVVAGPTERAAQLGPAVRRFAAALSAPLLADALSGARFGAPNGAHVVAGYDLFLGDGDVREHLAPEVIVRVGVSPTSAALQRWLFHHDGVRQVVIDDGGRWKDHGSTATAYLRADPVDTLDRLTDRLVGTSPDRAVASGGADGATGAGGSWGARWRAADEAARAAIGSDDEGPTEPRVLTDALAALPPGGVFFVSSSMPVRDLDAYAHPVDSPIRVVANRGASGIDGVVSSAYGAASQSDSPTVCVIGDIAFFHDQNGLLWSREDDADVVFVVIDNDGGGIFHMLPVSEHEPHFTRYFATPHGIDPSHAAATHGLHFDQVAPSAVRSAVESAIERGGSVVLRVTTDRTTDQERRAATRDAVVRSVHEALG